MVIPPYFFQGESPMTFSHGAFPLFIIYLSKTPLENIYQIPHIQRYEGISISPSPILFYLGLYLFSGPDNGVPD